MIEYFDLGEEYFDLGTALCYNRIKYGSTIANKSKYLLCVKIPKIPLINHFHNSKKLFSNM